MEENLFIARSILILLFTSFVIITFLVKKSFNNKYRRLKFIENRNKFSIYKLKKDSDYKRMFKSLSDSLDPLCIKEVDNQSDVILFVKKNQDLFRLDTSSFLLFKEEGEYVVALISSTINGSMISFMSLYAHSVWKAKHKHEVIVPKDIHPSF